MMIAPTSIGTQKSLMIFMASAVIASQAKIRIKVQGFTGYVSWWMMVVLWLLVVASPGAARAPRAEHLVEKEKKERPIERPSETIDDGSDDPGERGDEQQPDFESAEGHGC
jgi:hypothetical protein